MNIRGDIEQGVAPEPMTEPCAMYFGEMARQYAFQNYLLDLVEYRDFSAINAAKALATVAKEEKERVKHLEKLRRGFAAFDAYRSFADIVCEGWLCRSVDNYLSYVYDLLVLVFQGNPNTLKTNETLTVKEILSHDSLADLITTISERRVHQLSYRGLADLSEYLDKQLSFPLFIKQDELELARRFVEVRNLVVHNRGVVSRISASRLPEMVPLVGTRIKIEHEEVISAVAVFTRSVIELESRAGEKFKIPKPIANKDEALKLTLSRANTVKQKASTPSSGSDTTGE